MKIPHLTAVTCQCHVQKMRRSCPQMCRYDVNVLQRQSMRLLMLILGSSFSWLGVFLQQPRMRRRPLQPGLQPQVLIWGNVLKYLRNIKFHQLLRIFFQLLVTTHNISIPDQTRRHRGDLSQGRRRRRGSEQWRGGRRRSGGRGRRPLCRGQRQPRGSELG